MSWRTLSKRVAVTCGLVCLTLAVLGRTASAQTGQCQPTSDLRTCLSVICPVPPPNETCNPRCMHYNPFTGQTYVESCDCRGLDECHVVQPAGPVCVLPDNGSGTANLPPEGCAYPSLADAMQIIDGPDTIQIDSFFDVFFDISRTPGGPLGGEVENYKSVLHMPMMGTGSLSGFTRNLQMMIQCETYVGPRIPGDPIQSFDTDMFRLQGQLPLGDPDFDLLRITAGTGFSMPSPGHTTLTRQPGGNWAVDSFFDITYRIDFIGAPGGPLGGRSGSTTGTIRMQSGATGLAVPDCTGICPAGTICEKTVTPNADGTVTICCDCNQQPQPCQPAPDGQSCTGTCTDTTRQCEPIAWGHDATGHTIITACDCRTPDECQLHVAAAAPYYCQGLCPNGTANICQPYPNSSGGFRCDCQCLSDADCDDGDPCTIDSCDPVTGQCVHIPVNCDDGNACTIDACDPATGACIHTPINCDDGDPCTIDACDPATGACTHTPINCDDGDPCTQDYCDSTTGGCVHQPIPGCGCDGTPKWSQPPTPDREDLASNVWITPNGPQQPNRVVSDDFKSDGRPITVVRWWGSYLNPEYMPPEFGGFGQPPYQIDGWFISFHRPLNTKIPVQRPPLGLYFAPRAAVLITPRLDIIPCDNHPVFEYCVNLAQCCLIQSNPDVRVPATDPCRCPAKPTYFCERHCFWYSLDIQAVVGVEWMPTQGALCCTEWFTQNYALADFWGWHTTQIEAGLRPALESRVMRGTALLPSPCPPLDQCPPTLPWLYGPWWLAQPVCPFTHRINMAFELLTNVTQVPPACPPFILTGAVSIKSHLNPAPPPSTIDLGIDLPLAPPASAGVESRKGGPTKIVLSFSEDIAADDESLDPGDEVMVNPPGSITSLSILGNQLTVDLTGVPNASCLQAVVENTTDGITTLGSEPLSGDNDVHVRVLRGDVSRDGSVNTSDYVAIRGRLGQSVTAANARYDVDLSGWINTSDYIAVRAFIGTSVTCP